MTSSSRGAIAGCGANSPGCCGRPASRDVPTDDLAEPYALQIAGDFAGAAAPGTRSAAPYEEARALAETDDPDLVRQAHRDLRAAGSESGAGAGDTTPARARRPRPVAAAASIHGAPHASPQGLSAREAEVLRLLAVSHGPRDRRDALHQPPHRLQARRGHPGQARRRLPRRSRRPRPPARPRLTHRASRPRRTTYTPCSSPSRLRRMRSPNA